MIDEAGAAEAATESHSPLATPDPADISSEPPRASIDRAFAAVDANEASQREADDADPGETATSHAEAPARFSADAKVAWQAAPDAIKAETCRALRELEGGLTRYQQAFEPLKPYFALAHQHNTTVHEAMERYTTLDRALLSDDPEDKLIAIQTVFEHAGISPTDFASIVLGQQQPQPPSDMPLRELRQEIARLKHQVGGVSSSLAERQYNEVERQVEAFARDHPRLDDNNFADTVSRLLATGMADGLDAAYDMADRLSPAPVSPQKPHADQTRKGQLSIAGAPTSGSNPVNRKAPATARESLDRTFASLGLG